MSLQGIRRIRGIHCIRQIRNEPNRMVRLVMSTLLSLFVVGCQTIPLDLELRGSQLPIEDERASRVLNEYLAMIEARSALRGSARVSLKGPEFKLNRPQRILVERPAHLRLEVVGLFDQLAAVLATDGRHYGFYDVSRSEVARGAVSESLLYDLAKIDLNISEVVGLLLAAPIPSAGIARSNVWLEPDGRIALIFAWPDADAESRCLEPPLRGVLDPNCFVSSDEIRDGGELFFFDTQGRLVEQRSVKPGGAIQYRALFEDYRPLVSDPSIDFPNQITIHSPATGSEARFVWKRVMLAEELPDSLFGLP